MNTTLNFVRTGAPPGRDGQTDMHHYTRMYHCMHKNSTTLIAWEAVRKMIDTGGMKHSCETSVHGL